MPHERSRFLEPLLKKELSWAPSIAVMGMRQVGKTTLIQGFCRQYYTFDSLSTLSQFEKSTESFLAEGPFPLGLDEAQKFPSLFDSLKFQIDRKRIPGRYLLTGSIRFASKKNIRESLTGRVSLLELLPFTLAETHSKSLSTFLEIAARFEGTKMIDRMSKRAWAGKKEVVAHLKSGGLPGICFKRDDKVREKLFKNHLETLFGRDIHFIHPTNLSITKLSELYSYLCESEGEPINYSVLARQVGTSPPTVKKAVQAMESLFLVRSHGKTFFSEDLGLSTYSMRFKEAPLKTQMLRFLFSELNAQRNYLMPTDCLMQQYSTRGGISIPFLFDLKKGHKLAIAVEPDEKLSDKTVKSLIWFRKKYPKSKLIALHSGTTATLNQAGVIGLPWNWVG